MLLFTSGCVKLQSDLAGGQEQLDSGIISDKNEKQAEISGLGSLCAGESECISFCLNNRGRCESYCKSNGANELCSIILNSSETPKESMNGTFSEEKKEEARQIVLQQECTSNPHPLFTKPFTDNSKIEEISPIGGVALSNPGGAARTYVTMEHDNSGMIPVYAPVDSVLKRVTNAYRNLADGKKAEYRLDFQASCEVSYVFDHLAAVVDTIKDFAPDIPAGSTQTGSEVSISFSAGDLVGYTDRNIINGNWDFMVLNTANEEDYVNPSRWVSDHYRYGVCPYDYFTEELKEKYYSLLQKPKNGKPDCRTVSRDVPGTLAGGWFQGNSTDAKGSRLQVASYIYMVDFEIVRDNGARFFVRDNEGDVVMPETITVGKSICYYDSEWNSYAYMKLLSDTEMNLAIGSGKCPLNFPDDYEVWER